MNEPKTKPAQRAHLTFIMAYPSGAPAGTAVAQEAPRPGIRHVVGITYKVPESLPVQTLQSRNNLPGSTPEA